MSLTGWHFIQTGGLALRKWVFEAGCSTFVQAFVMKISGLTLFGTYSLTKKSPGLVPTVHPLLWATGFLGGDELNQGEFLGMWDQEKLCFLDRTQILSSF